MQVAGVLIGDGRTFSADPRFSRRCTSTRAFVSWVIILIVAPSLPMMAPTMSLGTRILEVRETVLVNYWHTI